MSSLFNEAIWFQGRGNHSTDPLDKFIFYLSAFNAITRHLSGKEVEKAEISKMIAPMGSYTVQMLREPLSILCDRKRLEIKGSDCQERCAALLAKGSIECIAEALMISKDIRGFVFHPSRTDIQPVSYEILIACNAILKEATSFLIGVSKSNVN